MPNKESRIFYLLAKFGLVFATEFLQHCVDLGKSLVVLDDVLLGALGDGLGGHRVAGLAAQHDDVHVAVVLPDLFQDGQPVGRRLLYGIQVVVEDDGVRFLKKMVEAFLAGMKDAHFAHAVGRDVVVEHLREQGIVVDDKDRLFHPERKVRNAWKSRSAYGFLRTGGQESRVHGGAQPGAVGQVDPSARAVADAALHRVGGEHQRGVEIDVGRRAQRPGEVRRRGEAEA